MRLNSVPEAPYLLRPFIGCSNNLSFQTTAGRLAKSTQQVVLLDGRQLGTLCHLAALRLPPKSANRAAPDDAARQLFFQVTTSCHSHPRILRACAHAPRTLSIDLKSGALGSSKGRIDKCLGLTAGWREPL